MSEGSGVTIRRSQTLRAGPEDELPSSLVLRVKLAGRQLWVLEWEPRTHKPVKPVKAGEAPPKPEALPPPTRAKLVTDIARLLVTKCSRVPLNTYIEFGGVEDALFKGCTSSKQLALQSSLWQDTLFILDTEEIEVPRKVPVHCPFCNCGCHPGGVIKDGWVPSVRAILTQSGPVDWLFARQYRCHGPGT